MKLRTLSPLCAVLVLSFAPAVYAAAPRTIPFQGVLTAPSGSYVPDGAHTLTLRLYNVATGGTALWTEAADSVTTRHGEFATTLGSPTAFPASVDFSIPYWVGIQVSGESAEMTPRIPLSTVPYAMGLSIPISANGTTSANALFITNSGTGGAAEFATLTTTNDSDTLTSLAFGSGTAVIGTTTGTGRAGTFSINNASNTLAALYGNTNGSGKAVAGINTGTGIAGFFQINNSSDDSDAVYGVTNGSGAAVHGVGSSLGATAIQADESGLGYAGIFKISNTANGVNAVFGQTNGGGDAVSGKATGKGNGVFGTASGVGSGVYGTASGSGAGVTADGTSGTSPALEVKNGTIEFTGAGVNTNTPGFLYKVAAGDIVNGWDALIDNAQCNNQPGAIVLAINDNQNDTRVLPDSISVGYNASKGKWFIHDNALNNIPSGTEFNVIVFRP